MRTDQSAAKNLFFGEILEENLFPYPTMCERDRELLGMMTDSIDDFLAPQHADLKKWDKEAHQPAEFIQSLRDMGLFGLIIPEENGGLGLSNAGYARVLSQTSRHDSSVSLTIGAHSSIGMKGILLSGNDEQKARYLPKLASGEMIAAFCLTESGAGSDAAAIRTTAKKNADGTWTLNGEKIWITNGGIAQMGIRASSTTTVAFQDVIVPAENVLGGEGKGFKVAMGILNNGRTGLGGGAVGGMKTLIQLATAQAKDRKQFGKPIADYGLVREKIAQMAIDCFASESAVWMVAHYIDSGCDDYSVEAAISKVFASEAIQRCAYESLQIAAGNGFMKEFPYEQVTRDSRILSIFEGTNEILRLYIALSGLKEVGSSLGELKNAVGAIFNNPIKGFGVLSGYASKRLRQSTGFGNDKILSKLDPRLKVAALVYEKYVVELSKAGDALLRMHGKKIADEQYQLKRIADVTVDLFVGLCTLARADALSKSDPKNGQQAVTIAAIFAQQAKRRMARNVRSMGRNEDDERDALAGFMLETGAYPWDVI